MPDKAIKSFKERCTCGGYAHTMNGRDPARPHMDYCPQREEYNEWYDATNTTKKEGPQ